MGRILPNRVTVQMRIAFQVPNCFFLSLQLSLLSEPTAPAPFHFQLMQGGSTRVNKSILPTKPSAGCCISGTVVNSRIQFLRCVSPDGVISWLAALREKTKVQWHEYPSIYSGRLIHHVHYRRILPFIGAH